MVMSAEKQLLIVTMEPDGVTEHVVVVKLAEEMATVPKVIVEGKSIYMDPPVGMGSGSTAEIV